MRPHETLEERWAGFNGLPNGTVAACSSGTAALHLALECLCTDADRAAGRVEVVVPDLAMVACARAVSLAGLTPVFVDCRDHDLNLDPALLGEAVGPNTLAVMAVHTYGRRCDLDAIDEYRSHCRHGFLVVEDLAEAHGVRPHRNTDAACWSFYANKVVSGEEGGAVAFHRDLPSKASLARSLRSLGFTAAHDFNHRPRGHNYRLADSLAALVLRSLDEYQAELTRRTVAARFYERHCPEPWRMPPRDVPWVYDVRINGLSAGELDGVVYSLRQTGHEARHCFKPLSRQAEYAGCRVVRRGRADALAREVFYLPLKGVTPNHCLEAVALARRLMWAGG